MPVFAVLNSSLASISLLSAVWIFSSIVLLKVLICSVICVVRLSVALVTVLVSSLSRVSKLSLKDFSVVFLNSSNFESNFGYIPS